MEINYICNNKLHSEKKSWLKYLSLVHNFKAISFTSESWSNQGSYFSTNPNSLKMVVDFSQFPQIKIKLSNLFFSSEMQKTLLENWCKNVEEQVFYWSKTDKLIPFPKVSFLSSPSYGGFSELISRLVVPGSLIILINFAVYTFLCYFMLKEIIGEIQYHENAPPNYLSINQVKPTVVNLYQNNLDIGKAAFLSALISGGWFLGAQQFLICLLIKFYSACAKKALICIIIFGIVQGLFYFAVTNYWWSLLFVLITLISNMLFGFFSRKLPFFIVKNQL